MRLRDLLKVSTKAILVNKSRSVLTMLGIIIGIASVILMISVGQAAQNYLLAQVASFGSDLVFVANGRGDETRGGPPSASIKQTLTDADLRKLRSQSWVKVAAGDVIVRDLLVGPGGEKNGTVDGSSPDEITIFSMSLAKGRFLEDDDIDSHAKVIVLGKDVADALFGQDNPLGKTVRLAKQNFRVIGVMAPSGTRFFSNIDEQVYVPYTTVFDLYNKDRLNFISLKPQGISAAQSKDRIRYLLRDTHKLDNPNGELSKDDFRVATQDDAIKNADTIGSVLQILLGSIASISLFVAGIGIMNIMYVTVTERTREIGLRVAIGALPRDILRQFLFEAIVLTCVAGTLGVFAGVFLSWLAIQIISSFQSGWSFVLPWNGIVLGFGVSSAIGIVFGYFPARKAAKLNPIEALRYE
jgi:putative ABC transport system permease protein